MASSKMSCPKLIVLSSLLVSVLALPQTSAGSGSAASTVASPITTSSSNTLSVQVSPTGTVLVSSSSGGSTPPTTTLDFNVEDLWNIYVGPVEKIQSLNTTVSPTPLPSSELVPPPPIFYGSNFGGVQNPLVVKNSSWSFPKDFWAGVASAAYQIEGAAQDEGRGPSIWDVLLHRVVGYSVANQTGDIADNQYYLYKQDIARIAAIGVKHYSFSISWSRVMPFGRGPVNEQALAHYDDLIQTCLDYGVEPIVTLFHWDLPLYLQIVYGGWLSEEIVPDFVEYARVIFSRYGSKVSKFFTVNEPIVYCDDYPLPDGYFPATSIPSAQQKYYCGQSTLLAHSQAYRLGKSMNISMISFKNNGGNKIPLTNSSADAQAVQLSWDFNEGWFADPIFLTGDYPASLKAYTSGFLRNFTQAEMQAINGSADIFAHDAYTSSFYYAPDDGIDSCLSNSSNPLYPGCFNTSNNYPSEDGGWNIGYAADPGSPWLHKSTDWVPSFLHYIQDTWKPAGGIAVSEFGFAEPFEELKQLEQDVRFDLARSSYYHDYMEAILIAMSEGVKVVGTLAWSIADNLEWTEGYTVKFGMQYVNFTTQERSFKSSFFTYLDAFNIYQET